jgi:hypothetical protein
MRISVDLPREHPQISVGLVPALDVEHGPAALGARGELEVDLLALGRDFDRDDFLEHLDAALDLRGFRRLVPEAIDEHLHPRDLFVLLALGLPQRLDLGFVRDQVVAVVADVVGEGAKRQVGDSRDDRVEKEAIVRHEDDGVRILVQVGLEPVSRLEIQVVRGLVEEQQAGTPEQEPGQGDAHLPAA